MSAYYLRTFTPQQLTLSKETTVMRIVKTLQTPKTLVKELEQ